MDEVLGGWDDLASGGFDAAGTLGHVSSVVRNLMLRVELFPPYRHACVV